MKIRYIFVIVGLLLLGLLSGVYSHSQSPSDTEKRLKLTLGDCVYSLVLPAASSLISGEPSELRFNNGEIIAAKLGEATFKDSKSKTTLHLQAIALDITHDESLSQIVSKLLTFDQRTILSNSEEGDRIYIEAIGADGGVSVLTGKSLSGLGLVMVVTAPKNFRLDELSYTVSKIVESSTSSNCD